MDISETASRVNDPEMILVAVGENDLDSVLKQLPDSWKNKVALLQNELLPGDWEKHQLIDPTVISVWFEKKKGQDFKVLVPSPIMGPKAEIIKTALATLDIPTWEVKNNDEMLFELVRKNLYILTTNIAGLKIGGNVNSLWNENRELALSVIDDVLTIQNHLTHYEHDRERLIEAMVEAINGDLAHNCMGRSAPGRLARALDYAKENNLNVKELERISQL
jgi:ketopantoate reductase